MSSRSGQRGVPPGGTLEPVTVAGESFDAATAPVIAHGSINDFTSTALEQLAFRVPEDVGPGYRAALTFRTQVATDRIRFLQPDAVWLEGRDCIEGGALGALIPRPNTHYRIDLAYVRPRVSTAAARPARCGGWSLG